MGGTLATAKGGSVSFPDDIMQEPSYVKPNRHRGSTILEHGVVAAYKVRKPRGHRFLAANAQAFWLLHEEHDRGLKTNFFNVAATIALCVRPVHLLRNDVIVPRESSRYFEDRHRC